MLGEQLSAVSELQAGAWGGCGHAKPFMLETSSIPDSSLLFWPQEPLYLGFRFEPTEHK